MSGTIPRATARCVKQVRGPESDRGDTRPEEVVKLSQQKKGRNEGHKGGDCWNSHGAAWAASCYLFCSKCRLSGGI